MKRLLTGAAAVGLAIVVAPAAYAVAPVPIHTFNDSSGLCLQPVPPS